VGLPWEPCVLLCKGLKEREEVWAGAVHSDVKDGSLTWVQHLRDAQYAFRRAFSECSRKDENKYWSHNLRLPRVLEADKVCKHAAWWLNAGEYDDGWCMMMDDDDVDNGVDAHADEDCDDKTKNSKNDSNGSHRRNNNVAYHTRVIVVIMQVVTTTLR
jgi:hypothetical protein